MFTQQSSGLTPEPNAPNTEMKRTPMVLSFKRHQRSAELPVPNGRPVSGRLLCRGRGARGHQHTHSHKAQPKTRLQQSPRVPSQHHRASRQPDQGTMPLPCRQAQQNDHPQHEQGPLRGHAPAAEQSIKAGQHQTRQSANMRRRPAQNPVKAHPCRTPPGPSHQARSQPSKQGHMQARNAHEVRHTRGPEDIPIAAVNRGLIARHQRCHNARPLGGIGITARRVQMRHQAIAHRLAPSFNGVCPSAGQAHGRWVFDAGAHITRGPNALLPKP